RRAEVVPRLPGRRQPVVRPLAAGEERAVVRRSRRRRAIERAGAVGRQRRRPRDRPARSRQPRSQSVLPGHGHSVPAHDGRVAGHRPRALRRFGVGAALAATVIADYLDHLAVERQLSPNTLDGYRRDLDALAAFADGHGLQPEALGSEDIRAFVADGHRRGLSPKSLQRRLSAVRSFYRWLLKRGRVKANPAAAVRAPKAPRKLPQVLDPDEAKALVEVP